MKVIGISMMNRLQKIGAWILGGVAAFGLLSRQQLSFGLRGVYLNGAITTQMIPLRVVVWIANKTIIGRVLVRSLSGVLICNGQVVASISQLINKRIASNSYIEQNILVDLHAQESLQALFVNVQSGNIDNLAFELVGEVVVGEQWPIGIKFNRVFTWVEIQQML